MGRPIRKPSRRDLAAWGRQWSRLQTVYSIDDTVIVGASRKPEPGEKDGESDWGLRPPVQFTRALLLNLDSNRHTFLCLLADQRKTSVTRLVSDMIWAFEVIMARLSPEPGGQLFPDVELLLDLFELYVEKKNESGNPNATVSERGPLSK